MAMRIFAALIILAVIVLGAGYFLANYSAKPIAMHPASPAQRDAAEHRLTQGLTIAQPTNPNLKAKTQSGAHATIHMAADDIDTMLASDQNIQKQLRARNVDAMQVAFDAPNQVLVNATIEYKGSPHNITIDGALTPNGSGGVAFHTDKTRVGLLPLPPGIAANQIDSQIGAALAKLEPKMPIYVDSVTVKNDDIYFKGTKK